ncbi:hypothetical protein MKX54_03520 [Alkalihalobacillus sp. FSL R5-0424]
MIPTIFVLRDSSELNKQWIDSFKVQEPDKVVEIYNEESALIADKVGIFLLENVLKEYHQAQHIRTIIIGKIPQEKKIINISVGGSYLSKRLLDLMFFR